MSGSARTAFRLLEQDAPRKLLRLTRKSSTRYRALSASLLEFSSTLGTDCITGRASPSDDYEITHIG